jgi:hypothetical protein
MDVTVPKESTDRKALISNHAGAVEAAAKERESSARNFLKPQRTTPPSSFQLAQCDDGDGACTNADIITEDKVGP